MIGLVHACVEYFTSSSGVCAGMAGNCRQAGESRLKVLFMAITRNPQFIAGQLTLAAKLVSRRVRQLPGAGRFTLLLSMMLVVIYWIFSNQLTSDAFLEVGKCPACFGFTICNSARSGNVWFTSWSKVRLLHYFNVDNIYTGGCILVRVHNYIYNLDRPWKYLIFLQLK